MAITTKGKMSMFLCSFRLDRSSRCIDNVANGGDDDDNDNDNDDDISVFLSSRQRFALYR